MTRIEKKFVELNQVGRKGFIPYITAGDPTLRHTAGLLEALARAGADMIEVGVPFSDPVADGPVIQRASQRALAAGTTLSSILDLLSEFHAGPNRKAGVLESNVAKAREVPLILFSYLNPIWQMGLDRFARRAKDVGVDGVLVTDLIPEEAAEVKAVFDAQELDLIFLIAPTSTEQRIRKICAVAGGFIYAVSRTGTTGTRESITGGLADFVGRIRRETDLPVAVGFGISSREQVETVWEVADAAVVGSAIVKVIEQFGSGENPGKNDPVVLSGEVEKFVRSLIPHRA